MQTVLISGGAGGIGLATVKRFGVEGFQVISLDRHTIPWDDISELMIPPVQVIADLTDDSEVEQAFEEISSDPDISRGISHLVGIAGGALPDEPILQTKGELPDPALFLASLDHNLVSQWRVLIHALPHLERAAHAGESPSVTFVSSINALAAYGMPGYSAAKAGLIGLTNSLTDFLGVRGIRINVLAPGTVPTPRTRAEWAHKPGHFEQADSRAALGHVGSPEAIAESLWALACHFPHTTGEVIAADGGQMKHQG